MVDGFARHAAQLGPAAVVLISIGCNTENGCTAAACGSPPTVVALVDGAGAPVAARGERRIRRGSNGGLAEPFDCRPTADAGTTACTNGVLTLYEFNLTPVVVYELRFASGDGSFTPWQLVPLELQKHTNPDFNGPGCSCSWYEAKPAPVSVPAEARLTADG